MDFHWPEARVVVELDGYAFHAHREAFETDRARDATLQVHDWRVIRLTDRRLAGQPRAVARLLDRLLAQPAGAGSRSGLTSAGAPRSGNGTSMASKSRGTTVPGKIAQAAQIARDAGVSLLALTHLSTRYFPVSYTHLTLPTTPYV